MGTEICPQNSITYNGTHCACPPGYLLNQTTKSCSLFNASSNIYTGSGVDYYAVSFPETVFSFDSIKKFTQSQAVFLEATLVMLVSWLFFCLYLRFMKVGDGRNVWFKIRWWISRLDICFATRHWLDDQKTVVKRKTELGGTFSIASWILFIGLFAALLYQIISKRAIEVHNVRATNAPELASFVNDMDFNITTVSSMSCSNLNSLGTLVSGNPGFIDQRIFNLTDFLNYTCHNTSIGPTLNFKCSKCQVVSDYMYISWQSVDLPSTPATAVGFQFNLSVNHHANRKHVSFVSGLLKNASTFDGRPLTFRGKNANILKFNLFPIIYHNLHDLRLVQPLFHEFIPGSFFHETTELQASLESPSNGLINTTLYINFLSDYVVEIQNKNIMGPVSFLADIGGLYCFSIGIFFYFLVQFEYRIKKLRHEDATMRKIRNRIKAQRNWDKLRKYVMYTWGCSSLDIDHKSSKEELSCCSLTIPTLQGKGSFHGSASSRKRGPLRRMDSISLNQTISLSSEKNAMLECTNTQGIKSSVSGCSFNNGRGLPNPKECPLKAEVLSSTNGGKNYSVGLFQEGGSYSLSGDNIIPLLPPLEFKTGSEIEMSQIQKNLQQLYDYNVMLSEKLLATQTLLHTLSSKSSLNQTVSQPEHGKVK